MKKTYVKLLAATALATVVAAGQVAQADVKSNVDLAKSVPVTNSVAEKLNAKFVDAQKALQLATDGGTNAKRVAVKGLNPAKEDLKTAQRDLETAQKAEARENKATDDAAALAIEGAQAPVDATKQTVTDTEKLIAAEQDKIKAAEDKLKNLNLVTGVSEEAKTRDIAAQNQIIENAKTQIETLNETLATNKQNLEDAEEAFARFKADKAKEVARVKAGRAEGVAKKQEKVTEAQTAVDEWTEAVKVLTAEVEAIKLELIKNGLTDAQLQALVAQAQTEIKDNLNVNQASKSVYRLYNSGLKVHLYTTDANEYEVLAERGWSQEGVAFKSAKEGTPVYRLYNAGLKVHLYTTDANEYAVLAGRGWSQEGVAFNSVKDGVPVYRLYNAGLKKHLYTTDANEYKVLATRGWTQEGVAFYSAK
ncbi:TPA: hypothetical protein TXJ06_001675 [Streptococcus suis]|nr:hypothetical protein [Streptococcus suis]